MIQFQAKSVQMMSADSPHPRLLIHQVLTVVSKQERQLVSWLSKENF